MMINESLRRSYKANRTYIAGNHDRRSNVERPVFDVAKGWTLVGDPEIISPARCDRPWSKDEDDRLLELVDAGMRIDVICTDLKRTADTVRLRALLLKHRAAYYPC